MRDLLRQSAQDDVILGEPKALAVHLVQHVLLHHMVHNSRLSSHDRGHILPNSADKLEIDIVGVSSHELVNIQPQKSGE
jgi:hypothetical protein